VKTIDERSTTTCSGATERSQEPVRSASQPSVARLLRKRWCD